MLPPNASWVGFSSNLMARQRKKISKAIECFFPGPPNWNGFWDYSTFPKKYRIFSKFDLWWPLVTLILTWGKTDRSSFEMIFDELSNAYFRFVLRLLGAELDGASRRPPPLRGRPRTFRSTGPVRVKNLSWLQRHQFGVLPTFYDTFYKCPFSPDFKTLEKSSPYSINGWWSQHKMH